MARYTYNKDYFKKINSHEKAYWLGFLYADGCIARFYKNDKVKSMSLEVGLCEQDENHLEALLKSMDSNVPIQHRVIAKKYNASRIVINCTSICEDLIRLGCIPKKSLVLSFPDTSILNEEYYNSFILGYFDGDGGVHYGETYFHDKHTNNTYLQYSYECHFSGTYEFLEKVKIILSENNIKTSKIYKDVRSHANSFFIYGKDNIDTFKRYIYKDSTLSLSRKRDKFFFIETNEDLKINKSHVCPV